MTRRPADGYVEGERVFGPPYGSFDADWVVRVALDQEPSLEPHAATELTARAWVVLRGIGEPDEDEVVRRLTAEGAGHSAATAVAAAAVGFVRSYRVPLE